MRSVIRLIDLLNKSVGHAFAWCIVILTLGVSYEVFVRYALRDPTSWAFDFSYILYGALFLMAGTRSRAVAMCVPMCSRGRWSPRFQAGLEIFPTSSSTSPVCWRSCLPAAATRMTRSPSRKSA